MEVLFGIDAVLFFKKNEVWTPVGCAENFEIRVDTETKSVKTVGDGQWSTTRAQKHAYSVSCSGLWQYDGGDDKTTQDDIMAYQVAGTHIEWYVSFKKNDKTTQYTEFGGFLLIKNTTTAAPNDFVNVSFEGEGKGALRIGPPPSCSLAITDYDFAQTGPSYAFYTVTINTVTGGTAPLFHYRVDGGAMDSSTAYEWYVNVISLPGAGLRPHVLEIWPVCDNGIDGVKTTINFTTSF